MATSEQTRPSVKSVKAGKPAKAAKPVNAGKQGASAVPPTPAPPKPAPPAQPAHPPKPQPPKTKTAKHPKAKAAPGREVAIPARDTELEKAAPAAEAATAAEATPEAATAPNRPSLTGKEAAPVLVKLPPPFVVRLAQISWMLSLVAGAVSIVYLFVIRQAQLPDIADMVRGVDGSRADATYSSAADILFWSVFTPAVAIVLAQIAMQVSFANRRPNVRWWQFGSILFQGGVFLIARELVVFGERAQPLEQIMLLQLGLATLGLLISLLPVALRWTARRHDVRRGDPVAPAVDGQL